MNYNNTPKIHSAEYYDELLFEMTSAWSSKLHETLSLTDVASNKTLSAALNLPLPDAKLTCTPLAEDQMMRGWKIPELDWGLNELKRMDRKIHRTARFKNPMSTSGTYYWLGSSILSIYIYIYSFQHIYIRLSARLWYLQCISTADRVILC